MKRIALGILLAALGGAAGFGLADPAGWPVESTILLVAVLATLVSVSAALAAYRALGQTKALRTDLTVLSRSIDLALRDFAQRSHKDVATIGEMNEQVARHLERIAGQLDRDEPAETVRPAADNVVPLAPARLPKAATIEPASASAGDSGAIEAAFRTAIAAGTFEISLQPIVSVANSAAAGFEAFAHLPIEGRGAIDIRRLAEALPGLGSAAFERILVHGALQAGRRRLGIAGAKMPVHAAISEALLGDRIELEAVLDTLAVYPELTRAAVFSLPAALLSSPGPTAGALQRLSGHGIRFAAEGWIEDTDDATPLARAGVAFVKISANRLLDRERSRRKLGPAIAIVEAADAAGIAVIATDVMTDEDAVSLIDLGVELMIGERFSLPRRLKPENVTGSQPDELRADYPNGSRTARI